MYGFKIIPRESFAVKLCPIITEYSGTAEGQNILWATLVIMFVCNRGDTIQYHGGLQSRELGQATYATGVPNSLGRRYHLTCI